MLIVDFNQLVVRFITSANDFMRAELMAGDCKNLCRQLRGRRWRSFMLETLQEE